MLKKLEELDVPIRYGHCVTELILENDRISGVLVSSSYNFKEDRGTETFRIEAGKGVILAGGGFGADIPFRMVQDPRLNREIDTTNKPFATAGLLKEAMRKGSCACTAVPYTAWTLGVTG